MKQLKSLLVILALALATAACDSNGPEPPPETDTVTFGSRLVNEPANNAECNFLEDPCTIIGYVHYPDPDEPPYTDGAPVDGVITQFRIRGYAIENDSLPATLVLAETEVDPDDDGTAEAAVVATGPTVMIPPAPEAGEEIPILEFEADLSVQQGQYLAIESTGVAVTYNASASDDSYWFMPPLVEGESPRTSNDDEGIGTLLVQADIEYEVE